METGKYFLSQEDKKLKLKNKKMEQQKLKRNIKLLERKKLYNDECDSIINKEKKKFGLEKVKFEI